jgi:hypothetical protein
MILTGPHSVYNCKLPTQFIFTTTVGSSTLLNVSYKIFTVILLKQLVQYIKEILRDYQCVFRRRQESTSYLFELIFIMEDADKFGIDFCLSFISLREPIVRWK